MFLTVPPYDSGGVWGEEVVSAGLGYETTEFMRRVRTSSRGETRALAKTRADMPAKKGVDRAVTRGAGIASWRLLVNELEEEEECWGGGTEAKERRKS